MGACFNSAPQTTTVTLDAFTKTTKTNTTTTTAIATTPLTSSMSTTSNATTTNATTAIVMTTNVTQAPVSANNKSVLIGGIVGGIVALLLIIGLIAFIVGRGRRRANDGQNDNDAPLQSISRPSNAPNSNDVAASNHALDRRSARAESQYSEIVLPSTLPSEPRPSHYGAFEDSDTSPNRTQYEDFAAIAD
jgi:ATP-dependent Zn protease